MKIRTFVILTFIALLFFLAFLFFQNLPNINTSSVDGSLENNKVIVIAENLNVPWSLAFLPDNKIIFTERSGVVKVVDSKENSTVSEVGRFDDTLQIGEGGLLGLALHPDFTQNKFIYFYQTYRDTNGQPKNRILRYKFDNNLTDRQVILDNIPGASLHNAGRIKFGPDKFLYITTGDAQNPSSAQNINSLGGKILRITDDGKPAPGNPFDSPVYSYGHRDPQGLAWDDQDRLWATEHGSQANDEINLIEAGKNYGWPNIEGNQERPGLVTSVVSSGNQTWAPSGLAFLDNSLYFAGLRGRALFKINLNETPLKVTPFLENEYGRIRDVVVGPDKKLYLTTSNKDGRGSPSNIDDRILVVDPKKL